MLCPLCENKETDTTTKELNGIKVEVKMILIYFKIIKILQNVRVDGTWWLHQTKENNITKVSLTDPNL